MTTLDQFNYPWKDREDAETGSVKDFMTIIPGGTAKRRGSATDFGGSSSSSLISFYDECVQLDSALDTRMNYYFHAKIKRISDEQKFRIYLVNYDDANSADATMQYLKTIIVQGGNDSDWFDVEFIFSPLIQFDCILFQLERTIKDYNETTTRYPVIIYEELSVVNNLLNGNKINTANLIKIGVQSHPGLMMCINGEEIHIGRTGIYEIKNGIITVNFFSVVEAAVENAQGGNPLTINGNAVSVEQYLNYLAALPPEKLSTATNSQCIFNKSKLRNIDAFTLDYMYEEA